MIMPDMFHILTTLSEGLLMTLEINGEMRVDLASFDRSQPQSGLYTPPAGI